MGYINFVKKASGNVWIQNKTNGRIMQLPVTCRIELDANGQTIRFWDGYNLAYNCEFADVNSTQVEPAAAQTVTTVNAFMTLLDSSFFFSVSGGGTSSSILLSATGIFDLGTSFITPAALVANTNDYTVAGGDDVMVWRISATGAVNLTGIAAPPAGTSPLRILRNVGANTITLQKQSVLSIADNRFDFPPATISLQGSGWRPMFYDQTSMRWAFLF